MVECEDFSLIFRKKGRKTKIGTVLAFSINEEYSVS